jgi:hypothetical protein
MKLKRSFDAIKAVESLKAVKYIVAKLSVVRLRVVRTLKESIYA